MFRLHNSYNLAAFSGYVTVNNEKRKAFRFPGSGKRLGESKLEDGSVIPSDKVDKLLDGSSEDKVSFFFNHWI